MGGGGFLPMDATDPARPAMSGCSKLSPCPKLASWLFTWIAFVVLLKAHRSNGQCVFSSVNWSLEMWKPHCICVHAHSKQLFFSNFPQMFCYLHSFLQTMFIRCWHERQGEREEESTKGVTDVYLWIWVGEGIKAFFKATQEGKKASSFD